MDRPGGRAYDPRMSATHKTLNVGWLLLGAGLVGLFFAKRAQSAEPREGTTPPEPAPPDEPSTAVSTRVFSVNGRSYRFTRPSPGRYTVELLGPSGVLAAYYYGPDGLEDLEGDPENIQLIARDRVDFPKDIPEFSDHLVEPPADSPVDYAPLD